MFKKSIFSIFFFLIVTSSFAQEEETSVTTVDTAQYGTGVYSDDPKEQKKAWEALDEKVANSPAVKNNWSDRTYKWVPAMEKFHDGALGYDIEKSPEENEQRYKDNGYSYSFKYSDSKIYGYSFFGVIVFLIIFYALKKYKSFETIK